LILNKYHAVDVCAVHSNPSTGNKYSEDFPVNLEGSVGISPLLFIIVTGDLPRDLDLVLRN